MLSQMPIKVEKVSKRLLDCEILRVAIIAELLEVAREEKTHVGEFQALLLKEDNEQVQELEKGKKEVEELTE